MSQPWPHLWLDPNFFLVLQKRIKQLGTAVLHAIQKMVRNLIRLQVTQRMRLGNVLRVFEKPNYSMAKSRSSLYMAQC